MTPRLAKYSILFSAVTAVFLSTTICNAFHTVPKHQQSIHQRKVLHHDFVKSSSRRLKNNNHVVSKRLSRVLTSNTALSLLSIPASISSIAAPFGSICALGLVILIHESGHFLSARYFGITVEEFSVGVGPRIAGFRRKVEPSTSSSDSNNDDDEEKGIDFNLRVIPLGGYVSFPGNYNTTLAFQQQVKADEKRMEINRLAREEKSTIRNVAAKFLARERTEADKKKKWWRFNRQSVGDGDDVVVEKDGTVTIPPIDYYTDPDLIQNRPATQRAIVLSAGIIFNIILSFSCFFGQLTVGSGLPRTVFQEGGLIGSVRDGASVGLLSQGDVILSLNGELLSSTKPSSVIEASESISRFVSGIRETTLGDTISLSVRKANTNTVKEIKVKPQPLNSEDPFGPLSIGVNVGPNFSGINFVKATSIGDAAIKSAAEVSEMTSAVARSLLLTFGSIFSGDKSVTQSLSGPVGVIKAGSSLVSKKDLNAVIGFMAIISINLAVINSFPFPALDGGQLLFLLVETATGGKFDQAKQQNINSAAFLVLLLVSILTTVGDLNLFGQ